MIQNQEGHHEETLHVKIDVKHPQGIQVPNSAHQIHQHAHAQEHPHEHAHHPHPHEHLHIHEDIQTYLDMGRLNPDWNFAEKHGRSTLPGLCSNQNHRSECICCLREIEKNPIQLGTNSKQLQFLGNGFPLYFIFLKYTIMMIALLILNYSILSFYWGVTNNYEYCVLQQVRVVNGQDSTCTGFMVQFSRTEGTVTSEETVIRLVSYIGQIVFLIYMRDNLRKAAEYLDERATTYSDYSLLFEHLPDRKQIQGDPNISGKKIGTLIRQFLHDHEFFDSKGVNPVKILFIGENEEIQSIQEMKRQKIEQLRKINEQWSENPTREKSAQQIKHRRNLKSKIRSFNLKLKQLKEQLHKQMEEENVDCDKVIVSFEHEHEREEVEEAIQDHKRSFLFPYFGKASQFVKIQRAPQPIEIIWQNINCSKQHHAKRVILSTLIFLILLAALTVSFYFLLRFKSQQVENATADAYSKPELANQLFSQAAAIVYCCLVFIIFFNKFLFSFVIHHLVEFEKHKTGENAEFSLCLKYATGLFFTTALMTLLVQGATSGNVYTRDYGVVEEETIMFFFSAFLVPLIWFVNPWYIYKWIRRKIHYGSKNITQEEANKIMEYPQYLMGKRYGQILEMSWFTYLYNTIIPFGSFLTLIGLSLYYWVDKYNLLRRSSILEGVSSKLGFKALKLLQFTLIMRPLGQFIFDHLVRDGWQWVSVVEICLGGLLLLLPMNAILDFFHEENFRGTSKSFTELSHQDIMGYEMFYPLTKQIELKKHYEKIENCSNEEHPHFKSIVHEEQSPDHHHSHKKHRKHKHQHAHAHNNHSIIRPHNTNKKQKDSSISDLNES